MTSGQISYDLRRLRIHGLIERIPGTHRYLPTLTGTRYGASAACATSTNCRLKPVTSTGACSILSASGRAASLRAQPYL